ncbi:MAG: TIM barrel protein [Daejeonella sp.]
MSNDRRRFLKYLSGIAGLALLPTTFSSCSTKVQGKSITEDNDQKKLFFDISLAQWSLHKAFLSKELDPIDFPVIAKKQFGISTVEYVNQFFMDKANNTSYLNELLKRCKDNDVENHLIMCDGEGNLGEPNDKKRLLAVENHYKWVDAAKYLGCATIRVNAYGEGTREDVHHAAVDGLSRLSEYAKKEKINVIVENHGSYSSNGIWLSSVMNEINKRNVGTLPDFNNFCIEHESGKCINEYDRYKGTLEMMPFAKGVSAKTIDFDESGNCVETDYYKMLKIVKDAGFKGYLGIEYEGEKLGEADGILKTKDLLIKVGTAIS